jgi:hypothetical protein
MKRMTIVAALGAATWAVGSPAAAQVDCSKIPAGPARTDCYIGLSRLHGQKAGIATTRAKQQADAAKLRRVTGKTAKTKGRKARKARRNRSP